MKLFAPISAKTYPPHAAPTLPLCAHTHAYAHTRLTSACCKVNLCRRHPTAVSLPTSLPGIVAVPAVLLLLHLRREFIGAEFRQLVVREFVVRRRHRMKGGAQGMGSWVGVRVLVLIRVRVSV